MRVAFDCRRRNRGEVHVCVAFCCLVLRAQRYHANYSAFAQPLCFFATWCNFVFRSARFVLMPAKGGKRPAAGAAPAEPPAKKKAGKSINARVTQKLNEHFRTLSPEEVDVIVDGNTQLTLRERLHADLVAKEKGQPPQHTHTQKHT